MFFGITFHAKDEMRCSIPAPTFMTNWKVEFPPEVEEAIALIIKPERPSLKRDKAVEDALSLIREYLMNRDSQISKPT